MDVQVELGFISPPPSIVGGQEIFSLSVNQILTFIERSSDQIKVKEYLVREHGEATHELVQLYKDLSTLLNVPEDKSNESAHPNKGEPENVSSGLSITPSILAVGKLAGLSWNEVLEMSIAHFNLVLQQLKANQRAEEEALKEAKRKRRN